MLVATQMTLKSGQSFSSLVPSTPQSMTDMRLTNGNTQLAGRTARAPYRTVAAVPLTHDCHAHGWQRPTDATRRATQPQAACNGGLAAIVRCHKSTLSTPWHPYHPCENPQVHAEGQVPAPDPVRGSSPMLIPTAKLRSAAVRPQRRSGVVGPLSDALEASPIARS